MDFRKVGLKNIQNNLSSNIMGRKKMKLILKLNWTRLRQHFITSLGILRILTVVHFRTTLIKYHELKAKKRTEES